MPYFTFNLSSVKLGLYGVSLTLPHWSQIGGKPLRYITAFRTENGQSYHRSRNGNVTPTRGEKLEASQEFSGSCGHCQS